MRASDGPTPSCRGPVEIDGMTVMLRTPRLSDGASWRETNLRYEKRLAPAFGHTDMTWLAAHSPYMWIHTWKQALSDTAQGWVSCLLVHLDGGREHVVGHLAMAGRHPRTGGTEVSTWTAGVPHTVTMWAQASLIIAGFEANPNVPHAVAPLAVQNVPVQRLAQAVGWSKLQTCRLLRTYDGKPTDHQIWFQGNTPENLAALQHTRDTLPDNGTTVAAECRTRSSWSDLMARGHYELRNWGRRAISAPNSRVAVDLSGKTVGYVEISVDPGSSTTELISRPHPGAAEDMLTPTVADMAGRLTHTPSSTRRIVVAVRADDQPLIDALSARGFQNEGPTLPTLSEAAVTRHLWAYVSEG
ncbi:GNAT family N-acetyltransferase [Mycobacterium sp. D16R24]|uniref:GNAT family N-acetyltransferase n=1 Tax=Mycobacterium sp. D16R24 TaxID=1855656 RepID=UPI001115C9A0|nr:GNAT family N-acetyltransferase [Mycobacterium sp. D16R24]